MLSRACAGVGGVDEDEFDSHGAALAPGAVAIGPQLCVIMLVPFLGPWGLKSGQTKCNKNKKNITNRVAIWSFLAMLCAQRVVFLGYMLDLV